MGLLGGFYMLKSFTNFPDSLDYGCSKTQNLHNQNIFELNQEWSCKLKHPTNGETNVEQGVVDLVWDLYKKTLRSLNPDLDLSIDVHWHNGNGVYTSILHLLRGEMVDRMCNLYLRNILT